MTWMLDPTSIEAQELFKLLLGMIFTVAAAFLIYKAAEIYFWQAIDARVNHRVKMLLGEVYGAPKQLAISAPRGQRPTTGVLPAVAATRVARGSPAARVSDADEASGNHDPRHHELIYSAATPPAVSRPKRVDDAWGTGSKEPLPKVLVPIPAEATAEEAPEPKKWVQPGKAGPRPISPPGANGKRGKAGKKRRKGTKGAQKKTGRPAPNLARETTPQKKPNEINRPIPAPEMALAV